ENSQLIVFGCQNNYAITESVEKYLSDCKRYAKKHGVYLVTDRVILANSLGMFLIDAKGNVLGGQKALTLNLTYTNLLLKGEEVCCIDTPCGKIFMCIDTDIYSPQIMRMASFLGCNIVISSQYINTADYSEERILFGAYNVSQSNGLFVINTNNNGSSFICPQINSDNDGFVISPTGLLPLTSIMNLEYMSKHDFSEKIFSILNTKFCDDNADHLYQIT
ncbi:MAG: hypothetical protein RSB96_01440, partial [Oscillospiraceae bacterium]